MILSESEININSSHFNTQKQNVMGNTNKPQKIIFGGMDASGKTTILYKLKLNLQIITVIPTIGFNVQSIQRKGTTLQIWDIGGGYALRPLMKHYFYGMCCLVYIISMDLSEQYMQETIDDLWKNFLVHIDVKVPILVFCNKKDIKIRGIQEIMKRVTNISGGRTVHFVQCCGITGQGLQEGIQWIVQKLRQKRKIKK